MKPIVIRLGALASVTLLGLFAIAQARYGKHDQPVEPTAATSLEQTSLAEAPGQQSTARFASGDETASAAEATVVPVSDTETIDDSGPFDTEPAPRYELQPPLPTALPQETSETPQDRYQEPAAADESSAGAVAPDSESAAEDAAEAAQDAAPDDTTEYEPPQRDPFQQQLQPLTSEAELQSPTTDRGPDNEFAGDRDGSSQPAADPTADIAASRTAPPADLTPISSTDAVAAASEGSGMPGERQLEGAQSSGLTVQKFAPPEIQVGKECVFQLKVRNTSAVMARGIVLRDEVPQKTRLVMTKPQARQDGAGHVVWEMSGLAPGEEAVFEMHLLPLAEGEVGSVATLAFEAQASARTLATRPQLALELAGPQQVMIGDEVRIGIEISNPGTGAAEQVVLLEDVPSGLRHPAGQRLEFEVGRLAPGEGRQLELVLTADEAGRIKNVLTARADGDVSVEETVEVEVLAPRLEVAIDGPKRRYLERQAVYSLALNNPGTAPAKEVELAAYLPPGLKFVEASNHGHYDPSTHTVVWGLEELPPQVQGAVELVTLPIEAGDHKLRVEGRAAQGLASESEQIVTVEGLAAIMFEVTDLEDPIEVGGETTYEVRVVNQGSKAATNVQVLATLPADMKALSASGPAQHTIEADRVSFAPLRRLAPKADTIYRLTVQGLAQGDLRVQVRVTTDDIEQPVTKEESTRVYADQ